MILDNLRSHLPPADGFALKDRNNVCGANQALS